MTEGSLSDTHVLSIRHITSFWSSGPLDRTQHYAWGPFQTGKSPTKSLSGNRGTKQIAKSTIVYSMEAKTRTWNIALLLLSWKQEQTPQSFCHSEHVCKRPQKLIIASKWICNTESTNNKHWLCLSNVYILS